ncbi:hypothetical protein [Hoeflea poritis]|uniref:Lipoprotein n=1 Tax=Hoeflea poritis TaxID=2993659 RepID=A0ABT4VTI3_9HYPH|nr:hypothetical protein [Hoeflea poritis]MDA4848020.1 hypothetical protein [Hoeflea poritis]
MRDGVFSSVPAIVGLCALVLSGCVSSSQDLVESSSNKRTFTVSQNYQQVYRNISKTASQCLTRGIVLSSQASWDVDAQLYSELGYGEIDFYLNNVGKDFYATAKVERQGSGTKVTVVSRERFKDRFSDSFQRWAKGSTAC